MVIDKTLKLVIDRRREEDDAPYTVFASSIPTRALKKYWALVNGAMGALHTSSDLGPRTAPKFALEAIRDVARARGPLYEADIEKNVINEMRRLAMVVMPDAAGWEDKIDRDAEGNIVSVVGCAKSGWEVIPLEEAISKGTISEDDGDEIMNLLAFFTLALSFYPVAERKTTMSAAAAYWGGRTTSSDFMAWKNSLPISTPGASSGATTTPASQTPSTHTPHGGVRILSGQPAPV